MPNKTPWNYKYAYHVVLATAYLGLDLTPTNQKTYQLLRCRTIFPFLIFILYCVLMSSFCLSKLLLSLWLMLLSTHNLWGALRLVFVLQLHLNPIHAVVQLRASMEHLNPIKTEDARVEKSVGPSKKQVRCPFYYIMLHKCISLEILSRGRGISGWR